MHRKMSSSIPGLHRDANSTLPHPKLWQPKMSLDGDTQQMPAGVGGLALAKKHGPGAPMGAFAMVRTPSVICGQAILVSYLEITHGTARGDPWSKTNGVDQKQYVCGL